MARWWRQALVFPVRGRRSPGDPSRESGSPPARRIRKARRPDGVVRHTARHRPDGWQPQFRVRHAGSHKDAWRPRLDAGADGNGGFARYRRAAAREARRCRAGAPVARPGWPEPRPLIRKGRCPRVAAGVGCRHGTKCAAGGRRQALRTVPQQAGQLHRSGLGGPCRAAETMARRAGRKRTAACGIPHPRQGSGGSPNVRGHRSGTRRKPVRQGGCWTAPDIHAHGPRLGRRGLPGDGDLPERRRSAAET